MKKNKNTEHWLITEFCKQCLPQIPKIIQSVVFRGSCWKEIWGKRQCCQFVVSLRMPLFWGSCDWEDWVLGCIYAFPLLTWLWEAWDHDSPRLQQKRNETEWLQNAPDWDENLWRGEIPFVSKPLKPSVDLIWFGISYIPVSSAFINPFPSTPFR